jgi:hypothetical protein
MKFYCLRVVFRTKREIGNDVADLIVWPLGGCREIRLSYSYRADQEGDEKRYSRRAVHRSRHEQRSDQFRRACPTRKRLEFYWFDADSLHRRRGRTYEFPQSFLNRPEKFCTSRA